MNRCLAGVHLTASTMVEWSFFCRCVLTSTLEADLEDRSHCRAEDSLTHRVLLSVHQSSFHLLLLGKLSKTDLRAQLTISRPTSTLPFTLLLVRCEIQQSTPSATTLAHTFSTFSSMLAFCSSACNSSYRWATVHKGESQIP